MSVPVRSPAREALRVAGWDRYTHLILDLEETTYGRIKTPDEEQLRVRYLAEVERCLPLYWEVPAAERPIVTQRGWRDEATGNLHLKADRSMLCAHPMQKTHGICMLLEEGSFGSEQGRATVMLNLQQVDAAVRIALTPAQYARLTPADYTWTVGHQPAQKLCYVHIRVHEPALPLLLPSRL